MPVKKQKKLTEKQTAEMDEEAKIYIEWQQSPITFIEKAWHLTPQPILPEYRKEVKQYIKDLELEKIEPKHYIKDYDPNKYESNKNKQLFVRGKHITWQQHLILLAFERRIKGKGSRKISISSGNGIGKSCTAAWIILWFLYTHPYAQIGCTSPSESQMFDVLWKECAVWLNRAPELVKGKFEWQSKYILINDSDDDKREKDHRWFARAKTARKENPEALSGLHGTNVLILVDEASAVPDEIFDHARGAMSEKTAIQFMISNPTRLLGYFARSHDDKHSKASYQTFTFSSLDSPVVDEEFLDEFDDKTLEDDAFRVFVLGLFPKEDQVDSDGFAPIFSKDSLIQIPVPNDHELSNKFFISKPILGIDPSGAGTDKAIFVVRDAFKAIIIKAVDETNETKLAAIALSIMDRFKVAEEDVYIDQFGVGAKTCVKLAKLGKNINGIDVGDKCEDDEDHEKYINIRARNYYGRLRPWILKGGELVSNKLWEQEWSSNRYARATEQNSRIKVMSKKRMAKLKIKSPNAMDALMLTFCNDDDAPTARLLTPADQDNMAHSNIDQMDNNNDNNNPLTDSIHSPI